MDLKASHIRRRSSLPPTEWCISEVNHSTHLRHFPLPPFAGFGAGLELDVHPNEDLAVRRRRESALGRPPVRGGLLRQLPSIFDECGSPSAGLFPAPPSSFSKYGGSNRGSRSDPCGNRPSTQRACPSPALSLFLKSSWQFFTFHGDCSSVG